jgi:hypothetical protein
MTASRTFSRRRISDLPVWANPVFHSAGTPALFEGFHQLSGRDTEPTE